MLSSTDSQRRAHLDAKGPGHCAPIRSDFADAQGPLLADSGSSQFFPKAAIGSNRGSAKVRYAEPITKGTPRPCAAETVDITCG